MSRMRDFLKGVPGAMRSAYAGGMWVFHALAFAATAAIVLSGTDWSFYLATRHPAWGGLVALAGIGGFFLPLILPAAMYLRGRARKDARLMRVATTFAEASLAAWLIIAAYKTLTGRIQPDVTGLALMTDVSRGFQFGVFRNGIFWGWPSHHTGVAFAGAIVLYQSLRGRFARVAPVIWAAIVGAGAAVGFHWLSDVVAGVLVGSATGYGVWRTRR